MHEPVLYFWSGWGLLFTLLYITSLFSSKIFDNKEFEILKYISIIFAFSFLFLVLTSSGFLAAFVTFTLGLFIYYIFAKIFDLI